MRRLLQSNSTLGVIQYGCNSHLLHLLLKDLKIPNVTVQVTKIIRYFRNTHLPAAWYKSLGGKKLVLPMKVRWNTVHQALNSFLKNRGILIQVSQNHKSGIDKEIYRLVNNMSLSDKAEELGLRLRPISVTLDRMQRDNTTIGIAVEIWHKVELDYLSQSGIVKAKYSERKSQALSPVHYLVNMVDHRFRGVHLTEEEKESGYGYLVDLDQRYLPLLMSRCAGAEPFKSYMYNDSLRSIQPLTWWKQTNIGKKLEWDVIKDRWLNLCEQPMCANTTTAGLERTLSTYGLVQSKLRNQFGNDKAFKLTAIYKHCNKSEHKAKKQNLNWAWETGNSQFSDESLDESEEESEVELFNIDSEGDAN